MNHPSNKISIFLPSLRGGGAERVMVNLANGFAEHGFPVDLVLVNAEGPYLSLVSNKVQIINLKCSRTLASLPSLINYLKVERPQSILSTQDGANVVLLLARFLARTPLRVVVRPTNNISSYSQSKYLRARLMPLFMRWTYSWADAVVAVSTALKEEIIQVTKIPDQKLYTIPNPAVTQDIAKAEEPLDHPWFQPNEPPVILGVGRLTAQKDFPTLIYAFAKLRTEQPARLMILGEGEDRVKLESLTRELEIETEVSFPGFVDNPFQYMKRASVFVLSSKWEGMPNALLQAMACGTPVVSTNCKTGPAEILENGTWGKLVSVGDVEALSSAIREALQGKIKSPSKAILESRYGIDTIVEEYLSTLLPS